MPRLLTETNQQMLDLLATRPYTSVELAEALGVETRAISWTLSRLRAWGKHGVISLGRAPFDITRKGTAPILWTISTSAVPPVPAISQAERKKRKQARALALRRERMAERKAKQEAEQVEEIEWRKEARERLKEIVPRRDWAVSALFGEKGAFW